MSHDRDPNWDGSETLRKQRDEVIRRQREAAAQDLHHLAGALRRNNTHNVTMMQEGETSHSLPADRSAELPKRVVYPAENQPTTYDQPSRPLGYPNAPGLTEKWPEKHVISSIRESNAFRECMGPGSNFTECMKKRGYVIGHEGYGLVKQDTLERIAEGAVDTLKRIAGGNTEKSMNPKDAVGINKAPLDYVPPVAILRMSRPLKNGAGKYGRANWRDGPPLKRTIYLAAALRHLMADLDGETIDPDSGLPHIDHAMAGLAVYVDAEALGNTVDDRPKAGGYSGLAKEYFGGKK